jgi:hypothetical protein
MYEGKILPTRFPEALEPLSEVCSWLPIGGLNGFTVVPVIGLPRDAPGFCLDVGEKHLRLNLGNDRLGRNRKVQEGSLQNISMAIAHEMPFICFALSRSRDNYQPTIHDHCSAWFSWDPGGSSPTR